MYLCFFFSFYMLLLLTFDIGLIIIVINRKVD